MSNELATLTLIAHASATCFVAGLIWFVQIVHYPLMRAVPASAFSAYVTAHQRRTTWVVAPVMLLEASSALLLVLMPHGEFVSMAMRWTGLALLALIWVSTFAVQVPLHSKLTMGFDRTA